MTPTCSTKPRTALPGHGGRIPGRNDTPDVRRMAARLDGCVLRQLKDKPRLAKESQA